MEPIDDSAPIAEVEVTSTVRDLYTKAIVAKADQPPRCTRCFKSTTPLPASQATNSNARVWTCANSKLYDLCDFAKSRKMVGTR